MCIIGFLCFVQGTCNLNSINATVTDDVRDVVHNKTRSVSVVDQCLGCFLFYVFSIYFDPRYMADKHFILLIAS